VVRVRQKGVLIRGVSGGLPIHQPKCTGENLTERPEGLFIVSESSSAITVSTDGTVKYDYYLADPRQVNEQPQYYLGN
jgi:hypothetical protein